MKILQVHNKYQHPGGEDVVVEAEKKLLEHHRHDVIQYLRDNNEITSFSPLQKVSLFWKTTWSQHSYDQIEKLIQEQKPDIVHFHNTFPLISPSAYYACNLVKVPVVQTLHNYRLLCPRADFFRSGRICEDCLGRSFPWPAVIHRCYHDSRARSVVVAMMLLTHSLLATWAKLVDVYIALTEFSSNKFSKGGIPKEKIVVKPNLVFPDPGLREELGSYAVFVGRFSPVQRILTLLDAWKKVAFVPLRIVGSGPEEPLVRDAIRKLNLENLKMLGQRPHEEVFAILKSSRLLVFTSDWYENFPLTIVEALACGVPVIAPRLGAMAEIIEHGRTGLFFRPGDAVDLAEKVRWLWSHEEEARKMGLQARKTYEDRYSPQRNYQTLMEIYELAIQMRRSRAQATAGR
jgi:glycosyltransferase involved in cell wall biosynthesis